MTEQRRRAAVAILVVLLLSPVVAHVALTAAPGYASFVVVGSSMEPTISRGSIVYVQATGEYAPGDSITFTQDGLIITHRIVAETPAGLVTKGDANNAVDGWRVTERQIVGEVVATVPAYGYLLGAVGTPLGYVLMILVPGVLTVVLEIRRLLNDI